MQTAKREARKIGKQMRAERDAGRRYGTFAKRNGLKRRKHS